MKAPGAGEHNLRQTERSVKGGQYGVSTGLMHRLWQGLVYVDTASDRSGGGKLVQLHGFYNLRKMKCPKRDDSRT